MSDLEKPQGGKLAQITSDIQFENDFGQDPIGLGRITQDQGAIAVCSLVGGFVGAAVAGIPLAAIVLVIGLNDILSINKDKAKRQREPEEVPEKEAIDVEATEVEEPVKAIAPTQAVEQKPAEVIPFPVPSSQTASASNPPAVAPKTNPKSQNNKWINNFVSQTALIWGNQGSGKSWMTRYIVQLKKDKGYRVVVLDPDSNRAEWQGVESYHDFEEIAEFLGWYVDELKGRYKAFNASNMTEDAWRAKLWADGKAIALICEEVTTYVDLIEDKELLTQFFRLGLTKSRKQEMPLTFVSHNNNQTALGGIKGLANLIEKMLQLELQTDIDPDTLQPVASGKGAVKLDGSNQWVPVTLPKLERKITNFGEVQPTVVQQPVKTKNEFCNVCETPLDESNTPTHEDASADGVCQDCFDHSWVEKVDIPKPATELKMSDSLAEPLKTIWLFAKKKGDWVTVRNVYDQKFKVLEGKKVEQIHQYLGLLADSGLGEIDEEDKSHSAVGFRSY